MNLSEPFSLLIIMAFAIDSYKNISCIILHVFAHFYRLLIDYDPVKVAGVF
jgi:hypothetical protein